MNAVMKPDAVIRVRFLTPKEGGRVSAIEGSEYGCPVMVNDHGFDCRFLLNRVTRFELGSEYDIEIKFLRADLALQQIERNTTVSLWEGKTIATGVVTKVLR
jgi:hypothetical protein